MIFGDGAGAMVLGEGENYLVSQLSSKGDDEVIRTPVFEGKSPFNKREQENPYIHMKGQETFRFAVTAMTHDLKNLIAQAGFSEGDIDWVVPHQANIRTVSYTHLFGHIVWKNRRNRSLKARGIDGEKERPKWQKEIYFPPFCVDFIRNRYLNI